tara:strand:- start:157 stop:762 length:606 start_codon:yes stop_codon:yes gene_type:complete
VKYLIYLAIFFTSTFCQGQIYEANEVNQDLIDRLDSCLEVNNLHELPSIKIATQQEGSEKDAIRDLFPWRPKPTPKPQPQPEPQPEPEPPTIENPTRPIFPPKPWFPINPEKPESPSPEKEVREAGLIGKLVSWLKANFPILGGSVAVFVNVSLVLVFLYLFYMISEFAKATTNQKHWVAAVLKEPFTQGLGLYNFFKKKK